MWSLSSTQSDRWQVRVIVELGADGEAGEPCFQFRNGCIDDTKIRRWTLHSDLDVSIAPEIIRCYRALANKQLSKSFNSKTQSSKTRILAIGPRSVTGEPKCEFRMTCELIIYCAKNLETNGAIVIREFRNFVRECEHPPPS